MWILTPSRVSELQVWKRMRTLRQKGHFRHVQTEGKPNRRSKKGGAKGSVSLWKESTELGCVSQGSYPRYFYLTTPSNSQGNWQKTKFGKDEVLLKCAAHDCSLHSPKFEDRSHEETLTHERWASKALWVWAKSIYKLKEHVNVPVEKGKSTPIASERPEEREFVVASRASRKKKNNSAQKNYWQYKGPEPQP